MVYLNNNKIIEISDISQIEEMFKFNFEIPDEILKRVGDIINGVKIEKESAVLRYTNLFDKTDFKSFNEMKLTKEEIDEGYEFILKNNPELVAAIKKSYENIKSFHISQFSNEASSWFIEPEEGKKLGQLTNPIERIGVYVPGGRYVLPSSVLMTVIPAQVAGVKEIAVCTPPQKDKTLNNLLLYIFKFLGIKEVYKIGGAQAIALMAYGGGEVIKVNKIAGPGNIYVTAAKKLLYGVTGIDSLAGPSEIVIIADDSSDPSLIAADLLSQAEHDPEAKSILLTDNKNTAEKTLNELNFQLEQLKVQYPKRFDVSIALKSLSDNCRLFYCESIALAIQASNLIAPEHLGLMTRDPFKTLESIKNAGSIFIGSNTPVAVGDYIGGTNHVIPTSGTAIFSSPLGVYDFCKKSAVTFYSREALLGEKKYIEDFADTENLLAHKNSVEIRFKQR